jgi:hypothetical protein
MRQLAISFIEIVFLTRLPSLDWRLGWTGSIRPPEAGCPHTDLRQMRASPLYFQFQNDYALCWR